MLQVVLIIILIVFGLSLSFLKSEMKRMTKIVDEEIRDIETSNQGTVNIIVPDDVDTSEPTLHSTQDIDCKKYTVGQTSGINVEIIKKNDKKTDTKVEDEVITSSNNDDDDNDPIKFF